MSGPLEGIIVLSADGRPVVHSHFANRIPSYPLLHSDYFATLLAGINTANAQITTSSSTLTSSSTGTNGSSVAGPSSNRIYFTKDIKPVIWVPGVPDVNPLDLQNDDEDEDDQDEDDTEAADVTANLAELSLASQLSARITASRSAPQPSSSSAIEDVNVWDEGGQPDTTTSPTKSQSTQASRPPPASIPPSTGEERGTHIVNKLPRH